MMYWVLSIYFGLFCGLANICYAFTKACVLTPQNLGSDHFQTPSNN